MPLSMGRPASPLPQSEVDAVVGAALEAGITFFDTADIYAPSADEMGHNERVLASALRTHGSPDVVVATKGGITRSGSDWGRNGSAAYLRGAVEKSLAALGVDVIDLYQFHRHDPDRDYREAMDTLAALREEGKIREVGISNASTEQIGIAADVLGEHLVSVQNEYSPKFRESAPELAWCREHGVAFLPWSPLGGTGGDATTLGARFPAFAEIAAARGISPQQVALAWELAAGDVVIPIPGATRVESIRDSAQAADVTLTADEIARLDACR